QDVVRCGAALGGAGEHQVQLLAHTGLTDEVVEAARPQARVGVAVTGDHGGAHRPVVIAAAIGTTVMAGRDMAGAVGADVRTAVVSVCTVIVGVRTVIVGVSAAAGEAGRFVGVHRVRPSRDSAPRSTAGTSSSPVSASTASVVCSAVVAGKPRPTSPSTTCSRTPDSTGGAG